MREFRIGDGGIHLGEPLASFQNVLGIAPSFSGESKALLARADGGGG
jgi:hypothetical protein